MGDSEVAVLALSAISALGIWGRWFALLLARCSGPARGVKARAAGWGRLVVAPLVCTAVLLTVLCTVSAQDVRGDAKYIAMYMFLGGAWVGLCSTTLGWFGVSVQDDVIERNNTAAASVLFGGLVGLTLAFAGANIGNGPGWWIVVVCAGVSTLAMAATWGLLAWFGDGEDEITIERDEQSSLRIGALLIGCGLIYGRAVAGDWHSFAATWRDFLAGAWPALGLIALEILILRRRQAARLRRQPLGGWLLPAVIYIGGAIGWVAARGPW